MRNLEKSEIPTKHICWHNLEVDISPKEKKSINLLLHSSTVENCQERVEVQDLQEGLPVITPVYEEKIPNEVASSSPNEKTLFNEIEDAPGFSNPKKQLEPLKGITNIKEQPYLHHMLTEDIPENIHVDTLLKSMSENDYCPYVLKPFQRYICINSLCRDQKSIPPFNYF